MLRFHTFRSPPFCKVPAFQKGDEVFLSRGTYQGTRGVFLNLKNDDTAWADVSERNGMIRSHPVEWLEHTPSQEQSADEFSSAAMASQLEEQHA